MRCCIAWCQVWLSEADLGLVMRFVNRPEAWQLVEGFARLCKPLPVVSEVYEMPPGWPYKLEKPLEKPLESTGPSPEQSLLLSGESYSLFDLNRDNPCDLPEVSDLEKTSALLLLAERPETEAILLAGRRFASLQKLRSSMAEILLEQEAGMHLRFQDDEDAMKTLLSFHPDGDRLLEDLVAIKVDCSPVDDDTRCLWVIKFDGYEEQLFMTELNSFSLI